MQASSAATKQIFHCSLLGIVTAQQVSDLVQRLSCLCENYEITRKMEPAQIYRYRESVFSKSPESASDGHLIAPESELRVQCRLKARNQSTNPDQKPILEPDVWTLHHFGQPLVPNAKDHSGYQAVAKSALEVEVGPNIEEFLEAMGYQFKYQFGVWAIRWHVLADDESVEPFYVHVLKMHKNSERHTCASPRCSPQCLAGFQVEEWKLIQQEWIVELFGYARNDDAQIVATTKVLFNFIFGVKQERNSLQTCLQQD